jgi:quercetin dioxygenase-like cupin family protein
MRTPILWLVTGLLVGYGAAATARQAPAAPDRGVQPVRLIDRDEVRVTRVELEPGAVRSIHAHTDVLYHLWIPLGDNLRLTTGTTVVDAKLGEAYFMANGTAHGFANVGRSPSAAMEVFVKDFRAGVQK